MKNKGIALGYTRLSYTRKGEEEVSPTRQRENNQIAAETRGFTLEEYEDVDGHKSGRYVYNRPGWLALEKRLSDPRVVALIANDLARLHRKGWRIGKLIDTLQEYNVRLILSDQNRMQIDTSDPMGKLFLQFIAMADEWYAEDLALRQLASIQRRKEKGVTVGTPPFGTIRDEDGYLMPRPDGVWLMADGNWRKGYEKQASPNGAVAWRGYFDAAVFVLEKFSTGRYGYGTLAELANHKAYAFRDRNGNPRPFQQDDPRRIIGNIYQYGGIVQNAEG